MKLGRRRKSSSTDGKEYSNESGFLNTKAKPSVYHAVVVIFLEFFAWGLLTTPVIEVLRVSILMIQTLRIWIRLWTWVYYYLYLHKLRTHLENIHFWSMDSFKASKAFFHFYLHHFLGHWGKIHTVFLTRSPKIVKWSASSTDHRVALHCTFIYMYWSKQVLKRKKSSQKEFFA